MGDPERTEIKSAAHYAKLDQDRNAGDRINGRGYDYDHSHPLHFAYLMRNGLHCRCQGKKVENNQRGLFNGKNAANR